MTIQRPVAAFSAVASLPVARHGATLTEVLMSLLVIGLGITSVFTLFPMSIARSIKATNSTNAKLLADSANEMYVYRRSILSRRPTRSPGTYYGHPKDYFLADAGNPVPDNAIPEPFAGTVMVDPFGGINADEFGMQKGRFGRVLRVANVLPVPTVDSDVYNQIGAYTSPDSWVTSVEDVPVRVDNMTIPGFTYIEFPPGVDLSGAVTLSTAAPSRVLLMTDDNTQSFTREHNGASSIVSIVTGTPNALQVQPVIPPAYLSRIGLVRVQNYERRYSFLYTLQFEEHGDPRGEVVVFFRREFGESEKSYKVKDNTIDPINRRLTVQLGAGFTGRTPGPGDYILGTWHDKPNQPPGNPRYRVVQGRWYRIVAVVELPTANWAVSGEPEYRLTLDHNWEGLVKPPNEPHVVMPRGIVGVFDLSSN